MSQENKSYRRRNLSSRRDQSENESYHRFQDEIKFYQRIDVSIMTFRNVRRSNIQE